MELRSLTPAVDTQELKWKKNTELLVGKTNKQKKVGIKLKSKYLYSIWIQMLSSSIT